MSRLAGVESEKDAVTMSTWIDDRDHALMLGDVMTGDGAILRGDHRSVITHRPVTPRRGSIKDELIDGMSAALHVHQNFDC